MKKRAKEPSVWAVEFQMEHMRAGDEWKLLSTNFFHSPSAAERAMRERRRREPLDSYRVSEYRRVRPSRASGKKGK